MNKLKKVLFKRTLMYCQAMRQSAEDNNTGTYCSFLAIYEVIIEAGLVEEFQEYVIKNRSVEDE